MGRCARSGNRHPRRALSTSGLLQDVPDLEPGDPDYACYFSLSEVTLTVEPKHFLDELVRQARGTSRTMVIIERINAPVRKSIQQGTNACGAKMESPSYAAV